MAVRGLIINRFEEYYLVESAEAYRTLRFEPSVAQLCCIIRLTPSQNLPPSLTEVVITGVFVPKGTGCRFRDLQWEEIQVVR
jgi:hypothetical protein